MEAILAWLKVSVDEDQQLSGIVYMHDIRQPRITNTARQNMRMFKQLCGNDNFQNVVLCTTFWGVVELGSAVTHEAQLLNDPQFWKPMATRGSRSFRLTQDRSLDLQVINHISSRNSRFLAQAQLEMRSGRALHETSTAASMPPELAKLRRYYEGEISAFWKRQQSNQQSMEQAALEEHQRAQERMQQRRRQELTALAAEEARRETERQQLEEAHAREMSKQREVINRANAEWEATARQAVLQRIQRKAESDQEIDATAREQARLAEQNRRCIRACTKRRKCSKCGQRLDQNGWLSCYRKKSPSSRVRPKLLNLAADMVADCCYCLSDFWFQCLSCGNHCPRRRLGHPEMIIRDAVPTLFGIFFR